MLLMESEGEYSRIFFKQCLEGVLSPHHISVSKSLQSQTYQKWLTFFRSYLLESRYFDLI